MSEDDNRRYEEEQSEDAETEPVNNGRHELPLIAHLLLLVIVVCRWFHFLQTVLFNLTLSITEIQGSIQRNAGGSTENPGMGGPMRPPPIDEK